MKQFQVPADQADPFLEHNKRWTEGKAEQSRGEKKVDGAKDYVLAWILEHRKTDISKLPLGETVVVQVHTPDGLKDLFRITRKNGGNKIDVKLIEAEEPTIAERFRKQTVNTSFEAIPQPEN